MNIDIPDALAEQLIAMGKTYATQDNRWTARPYYFQIREMKKMYGVDPDYTEDRVWILNDDCEYVVFEKPDDSRLDDFIETGVATQEHLSGVFFTEDAINRHLNANRHNYAKDAGTYVSHAGRNPEMSAIVELLLHLGKAKDDSSTKAQTP